MGGESRPPPDWFRITDSPSERFSQVNTSTKTHTYEATAYRDGKWWTFEIPELNGPAPVEGERIVAMGQARTIRDLDQAAREVAALWLDVEEDEVTVHVTAQMPKEAAELWTGAAEAEEAARQAVKDAARLKREAVAAMKARGINQAETGLLFGISTQRVGQLINS